jgi:hypothetical protein
MALWPNTRRDIVGFQPTFTPAHAALLQVGQRVQRNIAYFANTTIEETSSVPEGAFQSRACLIAPIIGGGLSSANNAIDIQFTQSGNVLAGGPMEGAATFALTGDGSLSLITGLAGDAFMTWTQTGALSLTIGLSGDLIASMTGSGALSMLVPISGDALATMTGAADLKGYLALAGDITPFTELSPENLAAAVWNSLAASYNDTGTMGEKLNDAGGAGNPWNTVIESGYTAGEIMQILAAFAAGKTDVVDLGGGLATVTFRDLGDTKDRIVGDMTNSERTTVTLDTDP